MKPRNKLWEKEVERFIIASNFKEEIDNLQKLINYHKKQLDYLEKLYPLEKKKFRKFVKDNNLSSFSFIDNYIQ